MNKLVYLEDKLADYYDEGCELNAHLQFLNLDASQEAAEKVEETNKRLEVIKMAMALTEKLIAAEERRTA